MSLNHKRLERIREEYCTAVVESMTTQDKDALIYNNLYMLVVYSDEEDLRTTVTNRFGSDFWDELEESVIAEEMFF